VQGVAGPPGIVEEEGDVVAGLPGSEGGAPGFVVLDGLLVVAQRLAGVPGPAVDGAELVLGDGPLLVVADGRQVQCLPVVAEGGVEMLQQRRLGLTCGQGVVEPFQGDRAELIVAGGAADLVAVGAQAKAVLEPARSRRLEGGGGGPVPRLPREPHPVARDDAPLAFTAGRRPAGGGVGELRGDISDQPGPFTIALPSRFSTSGGAAAAAVARSSPVLGATASARLVTVGSWALHSDQATAVPHVSHLTPAAGPRLTLPP
jgi:hypothetical protein